VNWASGGVFSIGGMVKVSSGGVETERDKFFTSQGVGHIYTINMMNYEYTPSLISKISMEAARINPEIRVKSCIDVQNVHVPINSPLYSGSANRALTEVMDFEREWNALNHRLRQSGIIVNNGVRAISITEDDRKKKAHRSDSFVHVRNHVKNGGVFFLCAVVITVVFPSYDLAQAHGLQIKKVIDDEVRFGQRVSRAVATVLSNFTPSTTNQAQAKLPRMLCSALNLTQLIPFRQEGIISTSGIAGLVNVKNSTPFWMDRFSSPEGSSSVTCAKAGKGKSLMGYVDTLELVGAGNTVIYIDLKGTEVYQCLSNAMDSVLQLDFSEKSTNFVNTMWISKNVADYTMADAVNATADMLSIFVNLQPGEGNIEDVKAILRAAVRSYYNKIGVRESNPDTWHRSREMDLLSLTQYIQSQRNERTSQKDDEFVKLFDTIMRRVTEGIRNNRLDNNECAVTLEDLLNHSVIIFSFNKNTDVSVSIVDQVRIFMVLAMSKRLAKYNKKHDLFTIIKAEEGQRYYTLPELGAGISDLASGSRSDNLSVDIILNDLHSLDREEFSALRANIANFIIGACDEKSANILETVFAKPQLAADVREIMHNPKKYQYVFAVHFEQGTTEVNALVRSDVPPEVADMFKTRSVMDADK
jgi:hypothetical protein